MPRRADYPEWVKKHLSKGVYVNKVGNKYYLYRAHSETRPGSNHPVKVVDEYLGRVTEEQGIIPVKEKHREVLSYDFAIPYAVDLCCQKILNGLRTSYRKNGTMVYVCAILSFLYGIADQELYLASWLSLKYPGLNIPDTPSEAALAGIERGKSMVTDVVKKTYGEDWLKIRAYFSNVVLLMPEGGTPTLPSRLSGHCVSLSRKYNLRLDESIKSL